MRFRKRFVIGLSLALAFSPSTPQAESTPAKVARTVRGVSRSVPPPPPPKVRARFNTKMMASKEVRAFNRSVLPSNNGFKRTPRRITLRPGTVIDRIGKYDGDFVAPVGTSRAMRALPPSSDVRPYQAWVVRRPMHVKAGLAAANYGQPGGGVQYKFEPLLHYMSTGTEYLANNGYLGRATPSDRGFLRGLFVTQSCW